ncbi:MAG: hypothetical protein K8W52_09665 [Deltaproteobacteria bacterium]|nr:hypothetical protein [Deltaproteobacteria bacterium]
MTSRCWLLLLVLVASCCDYQVWAGDTPDALVLAETTEGDLLLGWTVRGVSTIATRAHDDGAFRVRDWTLGGRPVRSADVRVVGGTGRFLAYRAGLAQFLTAAGEPVGEPFSIHTNAEVAASTAGFVIAWAEGDHAWATVVTDERSPRTALDLGEMVGASNVAVAANRDLAVVLWTERTGELRDVRLDAAGQILDVPGALLGYNVRPGLRVGGRDDGFLIVAGNETLTLAPDGTLVRRGPLEVTVNSLITTADGFTEAFVTDASGRTFPSQAALHVRTLAVTGALRSDAISEGLAAVVAGGSLATTIAVVRQHLAPAAEATIEVQTVTGGTFGPRTTVATFPYTLECVYGGSEGGSPIFCNCPE